MLPASQGDCGRHARSCSPAVFCVVALITRAVGREAGISRSVGRRVSWPWYSDVRVDQLAAPECRQRSVSKEPRSPRRRARMDARGAVHLHGAVPRLPGMRAPWHGVGGGSAVGPPRLDLN